MSPLLGPAAGPSTAGADAVSTGRRWSGCFGNAVPMSVSLRLQLLGDQEGELQRLAGVEARIAVGVVAVGEAVLGHRLGAADALGHVLAGHLEMHAAGMGAFGAMHREEALHLGEDAVERAGLVAA